MRDQFRFKNEDVKTETLRLRNYRSRISIDVCVVRANKQDNKQTEKLNKRKWTQVN